MGQLSRSDTGIIDDIVVSAMQSGKEPGVAISLTGPRGDYSRAYGVCKKGLVRDHPMQVDKKMRIGSITKSFTATAIFQQIDRGYLNLTDTLDKFISGVPNGDKITVEHMLTMRSGVYDYATYFPCQLMVTFWPTYPFIHTSKLIDLIKKNPSTFEPGTSYAYTNSNYILLGEILGQVAKRPVWQVLVDDVIKPLGLTNTQWPTGKKVPDPHANGYSNRLLLKSHLKDQTNVNPDLFGAAGLITSTVGDLQKWAEYLKTEALLSPEMHKLRTETFWDQPYPGEGPDHYSYGLGLVKFGSWVGHDGSVPGFSAVAMYDTVSGATFAGVENLQTTGLAVFSRIFERIATVLYPDSMK